MRILAATDFSTRSNRALRQAGLLAQAEGIELHIVHVIDDDLPDELIRLETREAKRILADQIASMAELSGVRCFPLVKTGDPFDGILRAADEIQPNLIVLGAHRKQLLLDIFVGTTIERVIRRSPFPVLMVNNEAQKKYQGVLVAVDMTDASANAIQKARSIGLVPDTAATLLYAFSPIWKGKMRIAGVDEPSIKSHIAAERQRAVNDLAAFLVTHEFNSPRWFMRVEEGEPLEVFTRAIEDIRADLLIMGTRNRPGFVKALIGSVTEEALRSLNIDIVVVPFQRPSREDRAAPVDDGL